MSHNPKETEKQVRPIFILSLPRAGSTLLQRILAAHHKIRTCSEPWLLLPLLSSLDSDVGVFAEYEHRGVVQGVGDLINLLPDGMETFENGVRSFAHNIYSSMTQNDEEYFLDKTPRYHLYAKELISCFPDAKFIFLWRNPLSIVSSINETWSEGRWKAYHYRVDLYKGLKNLIKAKEDMDGNYIELRYEDLIDDPEGSVSELCKYLEIEFEDIMLSLENTSVLKGALGDPTGVRKFDKIDSSQKSRWVNHFCNPFRKWWGLRYLEWIGTKDLAAMGYDKIELGSILREHAPRGVRLLISDLLRWLYGIVYVTFELGLLYEKWVRFRAGRVTDVVAHR